MGLIVEIALLVVGCSALGFQVVSGIAIVGLDHVVERAKSPAQFWFMIGIQLLAVLVSLSALAAIVHR
jgi:hypothetical protein